MVTIIHVPNQEQGFVAAKQKLYEYCDKKTILFLSGGRTPKDLYHELAEEKKLEIGAVGLVDERYGEKFWENSNEKMIRESGLLEFLEAKHIPFYPILKSHSELVSESQMLNQVQHDNWRQLTAEYIDQELRSLLFSSFPKSIAILGVGLDGHTAGIAGNRADFKNPIFHFNDKDLLVATFNDQKGMFKERITMTFNALSAIDMLLVLVFGDDKKKALDLMFSEGSEEEIPSRFLSRPDIAKKTLLITDQKI